VLRLGLLSFCSRHFSLSCFGGDPVMNCKRLFLFHASVTKLSANNQ